MPYSMLSGAVVTDVGSMEHQQAMLEQPVAVRDGDDLIQAVDAPVVTPSEEVQDDNVTKIEINTETNEVVTDEETPAEEVPAEDVEEAPVNEDVSKAADEAGAEMASAMAGQQELLAQAIERGLDPNIVDVLRQEFDSKGQISEDSYKALADAGYPKAFVDSYIAGQSAVAQRFAESIIAYAGGSEKFDAVKSYMLANAPSQVQAFNDAIERNDVATIKALIDSGKTLMGKSLGNAPKRNLAASAKPKAVVTSKEPAGYENRSEMVKAMSDKRYGRDAAYTREVELRVFKSNF